MSCCRRACFSSRAGRDRGAARSAAGSARKREVGAVGTRRPRATRRLLATSRPRLHGRRGRSCRRRAMARGGNNERIYSIREQSSRQQLQRSLWASRLAHSVAARGPTPASWALRSGGRRRSGDRSYPPLGASEQYYECDSFKQNIGGSTVWW